ncbi:MAG: D-alanine--D-alanine ligase family protein [Thermoanaerobaculia bacterium]|nr:D-alanine--D-alanine ligase family protein [Thermoanaerobaculia bacterium]
MAKIGVVFGGRSVEHEVSLVSARTVFQAVLDAGHEAVPIGIAPDGVWVDAATAAAAIRGELARLPSPGGAILPSLARLTEAGVDALFPITHGTWGEDGTLQGLCEMVDLPYVGPNVTTSAVAMDKLQTKRLLASVGVPVVDFEAVTRREFEPAPAAFLARCARLPLPLFVKPSVGGSSVGVQKVNDYAELEAAVRFALRFDDAVLVERGVNGRELEVAVLGDETIAASVVGEIVPGRDFYDYEDKYLTDDAQLIAPADLPEAVSDRLRAIAVQAFSALGGTGMARVDFLLEGNTPYLNELNTLPGFTRISMYPRLWGLTGVPLPQLVGRLIDIAFARHQSRHRLDQGIREWIAQLAARG